MPSHWSGRPADVAHVVASRSVWPWFRYFCSAPSENHHYSGEGGKGGRALLDELRGSPATLVVFHSSHESLLRDIEVADALKGEDVHAIAQSRKCAALELDKVATRSLLSRLSIPVPEAPPAHPARGTGGHWIVKRRHGTEGSGSRIVGDAGLREVGTDEFAERYVDGREYSVLAFAEGSRVATLPIVDKGYTRHDLSPPFLRARISPPADLDPELESAMLKITNTVALHAGCEGWLEVEFVVADGAGPLVLEVNSRLAGTVRVSATAARVPVFDLAARPDLVGHLPARGHAVEVPWSGPMVLDPCRETYATSRLSVGGDDLQEIGRRFRELGVDLDAVRTALGRR
jgi:ATP-grasp domain